jgi:hypothetical protein
MFPKIPTHITPPIEQRLPQVDARVPDLHSQLEALLDAVWAAEENWRFDDRLDLAFKRRRD